MLRTPREKFFVSPLRAEFDKILTSPAFEEASLAALLQMQMEIPASTDAMLGLDRSSQLAGATRYLDILTNLTKPPPKQSPVKSPQLNYDAGV